MTPFLSPAAKAQQSPGMSIRGLVSKQTPPPQTRALIGTPAMRVPKKTPGGSKVRGLKHTPAMRVLKSALKQSAKLAPRSTSQVKAVPNFAQLHAQHQHQEERFKARGRRKLVRQSAVKQSAAKRPRIHEDFPTNNQQDEPEETVLSPVRVRRITFDESSHGASLCVPQSARRQSQTQSRLLPRMPMSERKPKPAARTTGINAPPPVSMLSKPAQRVPLTRSSRKAPRPAFNNNNNNQTPSRMATAGLNLGRSFTPGSVLRKKHQRQSAIKASAKKKDKPQQRSPITVAKIHSRQRQQQKKKAASSSTIGGGLLDGFGSDDELKSVWIRRSPRNHNIERAVPMNHSLSQSRDRFMPDPIASQLGKLRSSPSRDRHAQVFTTGCSISLRPRPTNQTVHFGSPK